MPSVKFIDADGSSRTVECPAGTSVMRSAQLNAVSGVYAECGGQLACATCHVYVEESQLAAFPAMSDDEDEMLEATASDRLPNSRLSCQLILAPGHEDVTVRLPEFQR